MTMTFTEQNRQTILKALDTAIMGANRSASKQPRFKEFFDQDIRDMREAQQIVRLWATSPETDKTTTKTK